MKQKLLLDGRYADLARCAWGNEYEIIPSIENKELQKEVAWHPDMSMCKIGSTYVVAPAVYERYRPILRDKHVLCGETHLKSHYPHDIAYNVLVSESFAFSNAEYTDCVVKRELTSQGIPLVQVNQGYTACSSLCIPKGIITADPSVAKAAVGRLDVLNITKGHVTLLGFDYGFIGGATGFAFGEVFVFGDFALHPDGIKIRRFLKDKKLKIHEIPNVLLTDVGTIIGID